MCCKCAYVGNLSAGSVNRGTKCEDVGHLEILKSKLYSDCMRDTMALTLENVSTDTHTHTHTHTNTHTPASPTL